MVIIFWIIDTDRNVEGLHILDGHMVHGLPLTVDAAGYLEVELASKVSRMGVTFTFPNVTKGGVVAMCSFEQPLHVTYPTITDSGLHLIISPSFITLTLFSEQGTEPVGSYAYPVELEDNKIYTVEIIRIGDSAYILAPNKTLHVF